MNKEYGGILLYLAPGIAYASGNDVLSLMWLEILLFIAVIISLVMVKLPIAQRFLVFALYAVSAVAILIATKDMPYSKNIYLINSACTLIPAIIWASSLAYLWQRKKHNKSSNLTGAKNAPSS